MPDMDFASALLNQPQPTIADVKATLATARKRLPECGEATGTLTAYVKALAAAANLSGLMETQYGLQLERNRDAIDQGAEMYAKTATPMLQGNNAQDYANLKEQWRASFIAKQTDALRQRVAAGLQDQAQAVGEALATAALANAKLVSSQTVILCDPSSWTLVGDLETFSAVERCRLSLVGRTGNELLTLLNALVDGGHDEEVARFSAAAVPFCEERKTQVYGSMGTPWKPGLSGTANGADVEYRDLCAVIARCAEVRASQTPAWLGVACQVTDDLCQAYESLCGASAVEARRTGNERYPLPWASEPAYSPFAGLTNGRRPITPMAKTTTAMKEINTSNLPKGLVNPRTGRPYNP